MPKSKSKSTQKSASKLAARRSRIARKASKSRWCKVKRYSCPKLKKQRGGACYDDIQQGGRKKIRSKPRGKTAQRKSRGKSAPKKKTQLKSKQRGGFGFTESEKERIGEYVDTAKDYAGRAKDSIRNTLSSALSPLKQKYQDYSARKASVDRYEQQQKKELQELANRQKRDRAQYAHDQKYNNQF